MIQPFNSITSPSSILFARYLKSCDELQRAYTRYGFYKVDPTIDFDEVINALEEGNFEILEEFIEGVEGKAGALRCRLRGVWDFHLYAYFNLYNEIIVYLSGPQKFKTKIDSTWNALITELPKAPPAKPTLLPVTP